MKPTSATLTNEYIMILENPEAAKGAAHEEAGNTGGRVLPAIMFTQGGRVNLSLAMTYADVQSLVHRASAPRDSDPRRHMNRPLMPDHARNIENYLIDNPQSYILPALTLTVASDLAVYAAKSPSPLRAAWVVLRPDTRFWVTDGQHRLVALTGSPEFRTKLVGALQRRPELGSDAVAVHLVFEREIDRIHQDFADAAQTKQIPASMLAAYNQREPFNRVLSQIVRDCALFADRVDMVSKTLSKKSQRVFLLNQVRGFLKELMLGDYAAAEDTVARVTGEQLRTKEQQDETIRRVSKLVNTLTDRMAPWNQVVALDPGTPAANKIPPIREKYLNMTATGLNVIGRIGYLVFTNVADVGKQAEYVEELAKVNWLKNNPDWRNNVILEVDGKLKLNTIRAAVNGAVGKVRERMGLPADW